MARNLEPKCKQCRRIGEKLFLKGERCQTQKCAIIKRNYPPGVHGPKGKKKNSEYGIQLQEKQKAKKEYLLMEKQFRLSFEKAKKMPGKAGENLFKILETRLDNIVFRLGFASSRALARQLVNHSHIIINNKPVNIPSYQVKPGDVIAIKENKKRAKIFSGLTERIKKDKIPGWINVDIKNLSAKILHEPTMEDIKSNVNSQMIVEFYSK